GWSNLMPMRMLSPPPSPPSSPLSPLSAPVSPPPSPSSPPGSAVQAARVRAPTAASAASAARVVFILGLLRWLLGTSADRGRRSVREDLAEEALGAVALRVVEERVRFGFLHDLPVGHEHHPVGRLAGEAHLVGDHHHCHALLGQADHHV